MSNQLVVTNIVSLNKHLTLLKFSSDADAIKGVIKTTLPESITWAIEITDCMALFQTDVSLVAFALAFGTESTPEETEERPGVTTIPEQSYNDVFHIAIAKDGSLIYHREEPEEDEE